MFAKLHFLEYYLSTTTSQEKEHSLMQKYENKSVCVKCSLGVTAVPAQHTLPQAPPAPRDSRALWTMPDWNSCSFCKKKVF